MDKAIKFFEKGGMNFDEYNYHKYGMRKGM